MLTGGLSIYRHPKVVVYETVAVQYHYRRKMYILAGRSRVVLRPTRTSLRTEGDGIRD